MTESRGGVLITVLILIPYFRLSSRPNNKVGNVYSDFNYWIDSNHHFAQSLDITISLAYNLSNLNSQ